MAAKKTQPPSPDRQRLDDLIALYGAFDEFNTLLEQAVDIDELLRLIDEHGGIAELDRLLGPLPDEPE